MLYILYNVSGHTKTRNTAGSQGPMPTLARNAPSFRCAGITVKLPGVPTDVTGRGSKPAVPVLAKGRDECTLYKDTTPCFVHGRCIVREKGICGAKSPFYRLKCIGTGCFFQKTPERKCFANKSAQGIRLVYRNSTKNSV